MEVNIKGHRVLIDDKHIQKVNAYKWFVIKYKNGTISFRGYLKGLKNE